MKNSGVLLAGILDGYRGGGFKRIWEVYWISGLSPTITTAASHGNGMPFVLEELYEQ